MNNVPYTYTLSCRVRRIYVHSVHLDSKIYGLQYDTYRLLTCTQEILKLHGDMYSTADQIYETPLPIKTPGKQDQKVLKL
jgi:hypothetical protein